MPLKTTHCEQDLGVCVSADLTWKDQVMGQAAQAMKHFGYIMQIWSPQSVDLVLKLEKIPQRASRYILEDLPFTSS